MVYVTFSINCVLESMRKSLKTECKRLSVAFVSQIRLSNCFSISCVFDSILWEKSWRKRKSWKNIWEKKILENILEVYRWINVRHLSGSLEEKIRKSCLVAHFRARRGGSDLPPSRLPGTSLHCSVASPQGSRVSPTSEHLSVSSGHLWFPPTTCSSSAGSQFGIDAS